MDNLNIRENTKPSLLELGLSAQSSGARTFWKDFLNNTQENKRSQKVKKSNKLKNITLY